LVPASGVASLEKVPFETGAGQAWIYVNQPGTIATPTVDYPIVQSYVDIFVSGCLEQEQRFGLEGFANIDQLLSRQVPSFFAQVRLQ
jgi:hypothetical protein